MSTHLVLAHALSPIHCGTGQAISGIDLPIAREKPTGTPLIPGSTLKGVLRSQPGGYEKGPADRNALKLHLHAFGPETENASEYAGSVQFGDLLLVFLPMRSVRGTFAWVTSPELLRRFGRSAKEAGLKDWDSSHVNVAVADALVAGERLKVKVGTTEKVVLEDFDFIAKSSPELQRLAKQVGEALFGNGKDASEVSHFVERTCVVSDDVMRVLTRVGMEVVARNRIDDETMTVADGALWTEEALPVESILAGLLVATPVKGDAPKDLVDHIRSLCKGPIQLGGKSTVGRGVCRLEVR